MSENQATGRRSPSLSQESAGGRSFYSSPGGSGDQDGPAPQLDELGRRVRAGLGIEAVLLLGLVVAGLVVALVRGTPASGTVLFGLHLSPAQGVLLGATGLVLLGVTVSGSHRLLKVVSLLQLAVYLVAFLVGLSASTEDSRGPGLTLGSGTGLADHALHGALTVIGLAALMASSADYLDPAPSPPAYPVRDEESRA